MYSNQTDNPLAGRQAGRQAGRNLTLDIYKGLLIILVVLRHVLQYSVSDEGGILTNFIWAVQMPGFMLVEGISQPGKWTVGALWAREFFFQLSIMHYRFLAGSY